MAQVGMVNGQLVLLNADQFTAQQDVALPQEQVHVIRGGIGAKMVPLGLQFLSERGVAKHDAMILLVDNHPTSVAAMVGAMHLHCVCALVSLSRLELLSYVVQQTGITKIVNASGSAGEFLQNAIRQALQSFDEKQARHVVAGEGNSERQPQWLEEFQNAIASSSEEVHAPIDGSFGGGVCLLTSGSVGVAKVVACSWQSMLCQGRVTCHEMFPNQPARVLCLTSISHAYAINTIFALLTSPFDTQSELLFAKTIKGFMPLLKDRVPSSACIDQSSGSPHRFITLMYGTPATYLSLLKLPSCRLHVDVAYSAGSPLSNPVFHEVQERFHVAVMQNYGSTETGNIAAWGLNKQYAASEQEVLQSSHCEYAGTLWPGVQMERNESTQELLVRSPWQSSGYIVNERLIVHGKYHRMADRGSFKRVDDRIVQVFLQERIRQPITVGNGEECAPQQLEQFFASHPHVSDAVVFTRYGDTCSRVQVRVVVQQGSTKPATADDLLTWYKLKRAAQNEELNWLPQASHLRIEIVPFLACSPAGKLLFN